MVADLQVNYFNARETWTDPVTGTSYVVAMRGDPISGRTAYKPVL